MRDVADDDDGDESCAASRHSPDDLCGRFESSGDTVFSHFQLHNKDIEII